MRYSIPSGMVRRTGSLAATLLLLVPRVYAQRARQFRVGVLFRDTTREAVAAELGAFLMRGGGLRLRSRTQPGGGDAVRRWCSGAPSPELARELVEPGGRGVRAEQPRRPRIAEGLRQCRHYLRLGRSGEGRLVDDIAHPGRNATGFSRGPHHAAKRVELLKEAFPTVTRLGIVTDSNFPGQEELAIVTDAARKLRMTAHAVDAHSREQHLEAITRLHAAGVDAFCFIFTGSAFAIRGELVAAVRETRLPTIYGQSRFADEGGLIAYSWRTLKFSALAASMPIGSCGCTPRDLPVQGPTEIELVLNLATARRKG